MGDGLKYEHGCKKYVLESTKFKFSGSTTTAVYIATTVHVLRSSISKLASGSIKILLHVPVFTVYMYYLI